MSADEVARLDEIRGEGVSRSAFVRELLRRAAPLDEAPSYPESLLLLRSPRAGRCRRRSRSNARSGRATSSPPASWRGCSAMSEIRSLTTSCLRA